MSEWTSKQEYDADQAREAMTREFTEDQIRLAVPHGVSRLDDKFTDKPCPHCENGYRYMGSDEGCPVCNNTKRVPITEAERWHVKQPGDVTDFTVAAAYTWQQLHSRIEKCEGCGGSAFVDSGNPDIPIKPCPTCTPLRRVVRDALAKVNG